MTRLSKVSLAAGLVAVALAIVNYFSFYPVHVTADDAEMFGAPFVAHRGERVALVVDTAVIRQAGASGRFSQTDWSYGWINLLLQEEGRYDILNITELQSDNALLQHQVWIFTRSALSSLEAKNLKGILEDISHNVNDNEAVVYLEAPDTNCAANDIVTSVLGHEVTPRRFTRMTHISSVSGFSHPPVPKFNLSSDGIVAGAPAEGIKPLVVFDSVAVLYETDRDGLRILVATFDFGQLAVTIQQGRPNDDFSVTPRITKRHGIEPLVSSDLCADSSYYKTFTPFFDLFERSLYTLIIGEESGEPLFPGGAHGAFVMSHDEEGMGDRAAWMARQEKKWGVTSATLVTPAAITARGLEEIVSSGGEVGLHVDQYSFFKRTGLPGLRPLRIEYTVEEQKQALDSRLQKASEIQADVVVNRNHWLLWSGNYTGMFRKLAGAGIRLDLSYGPIGKGIAGYMFGTCFPFVPLDTNGFPLPILELPFLFQDDEDFAAEYLDSIFDTTVFRQEIVNVVFHTNTMGHSPDTLLLWGWQESFARAKKANLPIIQYIDIVKALQRREVTLPPETLE